ncbi:FAD-dependent oxidoreductase [Cetobacterium sp. 8H]|uniref:FAD-dependent oxidoreductase n=1 Tax=Cetobacterium sp. 8H TaxID=2759681 RepID=UPI00163BC9D2|nr:FAD-dependent oxidoreductase [Cetobacterium sp. 8H]MBC2852120.1 FAD-dependent oxidoreductase [Cetobacterium sp. 8H]
MKIVVVGAVAAGTSVIAKARRNNEKVEIVAYTSGSDISYSGCGIPYYIGEDYIKRGNLTPRDAEWFESRFNMKLNINHKVLSVNPNLKTIEVLNEITGETFEDSYDKLVITTGARPRKIDFDNKNIFYIRDVETGDKLKKFIHETSPKKALIVGSGYIGLEMVENLIQRGIEVTVIEMNNSIGRLDPDISIYLEKYLEKKGVNLILGDSVKDISVDGKTITTNRGKSIKIDFIVAAIGVIPNVEFLEGSGIELGKSRAIKVNRYLETNLPDIYAAGDCATTYSLLTGEETYVPLGSTANKMGRILGDRITGGSLEFKGILGTSIFKIFDMVVASTGLDETEALEKGYSIEIIHNIKPNQTEYLEASREMVIKAIADRKTGKLLGVQILGENGVDKRIDVFATLLTFGATVDQLFHLDLAYAPPFSTTKDPVNYTGMILNNAINGKNKIITPKELNEKRDEFLIIDVRSKSQYEVAHIEDAINIPLETLRERIKELDKSKKIAVHCNKGVTGNMAQNILLNNGFDVSNISGGYSNYSIISKKS